MARSLMAVLVISAGLALPCPTTASEPGWVGQVVKPLDQRAQIQQTPIIYRPYRPLHFYGNTVRRLYYHGRALPTPGEIGSGLRAIAQPW